MEGVSLDEWMSALMADVFSLPTNLHILPWFELHKSSQSVLLSNYIDVIEDFEKYHLPP